MNLALSPTPITRRLLALTASAALALAAVSATTANAKTVVGSGKIAEQSRAVSGFTSISLMSSADVEIRQGTREGVTVIADDNIIPLIETRVRGKILEIDSKESFRTKNAIRVIVDLVTLDGISLSGSGNFTAKTAVKSDTLKVRIGGSGNVQLKPLTANVVDVGIEGSGDFTASGSAAKQTLLIAGSGNIVAQELAGQTVSASISGSGDINVWAAQALNASISGAGSIGYKGKPTVKTKVDGAGDVAPL